MIPGRPRTRDLHEFLAWLAIVEPRGGKFAKSSGQESAGTHDLLQELRRGPADEYNIVVTARARGTVPTALWNSSYFVFVGGEQA